MLNLEHHDIFRIPKDFTAKYSPTLFERVKETYQSFDHIIGKGLDQWLITFSGGKDSSLTLILALEYILKYPKKVKRVDVIYSDTKMEIPSINRFARMFLKHIKTDKRFSSLPLHVHIVYPEMKNRYWVKVLGKGYPPPHQKFRWCTDKMKIKPAEKELSKFISPGKTAILTGVRFGESMSRDQRLNQSCSRGGECGQGLWFQESARLNAGYLAPIVNWPVCDLWDFIVGFAPIYGYPTKSLPTVYNGHDTRFGCWTCTVVKQDKAMLRTIEQEEWSHLKPLYDFRNHLWDSTRPKRTRVLRKDGTKSKLKKDERKRLLKELLVVQKQVGMTIISSPEVKFIKELWKTEKQTKIKR